MSVMKEWLKWLTYTLLAVIFIAILVSGGVVFLAIGTIIGLMFMGALLIAFVAYVIKEIWEHAIRSR